MQQRTKETLPTPHPRENWHVELESKIKDLHDDNEWINSRLTDDGDWEWENNEIATK